MSDSIQWSQTHDRQLNPFVLILSGTHVVGKETIAMSLADHFRCKWLKAEQIHSFAVTGAGSQEKRGLDYNQVFDRIWHSKLQQLGFDPSKVSTSTSNLEEQHSSIRCCNVITCYAMTPMVRHAMRSSMLEHGIQPFFVIMNISKEILSGRTLGAEEQDLAARIMKSKQADIQQPLETETDVLLIDSTKDIDGMLVDISNGIESLAKIT